MNWEKPNGRDSIGAPPIAPVASQLSVASSSCQHPQHFHCLPLLATEGCSAQSSGLEVLENLRPCPRIPCSLVPQGNVCFMLAPGLPPCDYIPVIFAWWNILHQLSFFPVPLLCYPAHVSWDHLINCLHISEASFGGTQTETLILPWY